MPVALGDRLALVAYIGLVPQHPQKAFRALAGTLAPAFVPAMLVVGPTLAGSMPTELPGIPTPPDAAVAVQVAVEPVPP